jgi:hypothetical protein
MRSWRSWMRRLADTWGLIVPVLVLAVSVQQPPDPMPDPPQAPEIYPGQSSHAQPPEGWFCQRQNSALSVPPEHACRCERMYDPDDPTVIREDKECSVWCHPDSCKCGVSGKPANPAGLTHP